MRLVDKIVMRKASELVINPRNSRSHSAEQVALIATSIKRFGFTMPLLVDDASVVIAGHGRLLAARELGLTELPTIDGSYLSAQERRAYMIADNQIALTAGWDLDMLSSEIGDLDQGGFDLSVLGFDDEALDNFRNEEAPRPPRRGRDRAESPVVQYNIVFDSDAQQQLWFGLLRRLKQQHPELPTIGARLAAFIEGQDG